MATELPQELLRRKREGEALTAEALRAFVTGIADGRICDGQIGAFAMAVCLRGMSQQETLDLTLAMRDSGRCIDWRPLALDGPLLDKHSTGGVGDLTSLVLAPMLAACGAFVPMLSGRGLGHTGGTLDKLEALPGYRSDVDLETLQRVVRDTGLAIVAAGPGLAPADRRLYAIRDVTATVESIPLITASILSKKLAAGADALVLDVKCGNGATLPSRLLSRALAASLVRVGSQAGLRCSALLTDMEQPLVSSIGNALELRAAIDYLRGDRTPPRLHALCLLLGGELLQQSGLADSDDAAQAMLQSARDSGRAGERFARMVQALGGPAEVLNTRSGLIAEAPVHVALKAPRSGVINAIDTRALGMAIVQLGGGRCHPADRIDPRVGLDEVLALGDTVEAGQALLWIHAADADSAASAQVRLAEAFGIADTAATLPPLLHARIDADEVSA